MRINYINYQRYPHKVGDEIQLHEMVFGYAYMVSNGPGKWLLFDRLGAICHYSHKLGKITERFPTCTRDWYRRWRENNRIVEDIIKVPEGVL